MYSENLCQEEFSEKYGTHLDLLLSHRLKQYIVPVCARV